MKDDATVDRFLDWMSEPIWGSERTPAVGPIITRWVALAVVLVVSGVPLGVLYVA